MKYNHLMNNPSDTPTMWLALYFGILSLGCTIASFSTASASVVQVTPTLGEPQQYRKLCAEALALAGKQLLNTAKCILKDAGCALTSLQDYTKPKKYTVEALLMYCACEHMSANEASLQIWLLLGLLLRVAMRMGYHRDPSLYSSVTPFEGEMRRRIWYLVYIFDVLSSFAVGLPDMIRQVQSDTQPPRNLLDSDFGVDTVELPPDRPFTELSPVSYVIVKSKLAKVFARAADISHAVETPDYADVLALDAELHKVHSEITPSLRFVSVQASIIMDPPPTIFARFKLELLYQKTRCVLHRRYLGWSHGGDAEEVSRDACVDAAMKVIGHLETVHAASQEGGQLSRAPFLLSALGVHDFLLAAMVLCLEVNRLTKIPPPDSQLHRGKILEMWKLLEMTNRVYRQPARYFTPPEKAVRALEVMLNRVRDLGMLIPGRIESD
jgi:Fungal specific transcription factor domain